jgi:UDP-glucuronate 4-epimerase
MKILVTGAAGFIGFHTCHKLLSEGHYVNGIDNINDYYDQNLKFDRLKELGINKDFAISFNKEIKSYTYENFKFTRIDIADSKSLNKLFENEKYDIVCNLAAQAGVRYSIENPYVYIESNIVGFLNILEACRYNKVKHLVYASSSSVYGENKKIPFETSDNVDFPISLYASTKKSNELMAHTYGHLYGFKTTGLRFFTVYGPWGRPDMAYFSFTESIIKNETIEVYNNGEMERDFTYIDDIVNGVCRVINQDISNRKHYKIYNIGNNKTVSLLEFIKSIEDALNKKAIRKMMPMQDGDVPRTWANIDDLIKDFNYSPKTDIQKGIKNFVKWYNKYYKL